MRKSTKVALTVVAAVGLASCGRKRYDPCEAASFNQAACQEAVNNRGYYHNGSWFPMIYSNPYPYYYDSYRGYVSRGGAVQAEPGASYGRPAGASPSGVERGGFGSSGGEHGAGE